jgi:putative hydrolase of the HAD superfamily
VNTKAVLFDWVDTLARIVPDWSESWLRTLSEAGIEMSRKDMVRGICAAELQIPDGRPMKWKDSVEEDIFIRYLRIVLEEAGAVVPERAVLLTIIAKIYELLSKCTYRLFSDVVPVIKTLKSRNVILGVISNMHGGLQTICHILKLSPYLDFTLTSGEAGVNKPDPEIFLEAIKRSGTSISETIYVGDQYEIDILGAEKVGLSPILIDRYGRYTDFNKCPVIHSLTELEALI